MYAKMSERSPAAEDSRAAPSTRLYASTMERGSAMRVSYSFRSVVSSPKFGPMDLSPSMRPCAPAAASRRCCSARSALPGPDRIAPPPSPLVPASASGLRVGAEAFAPDRISIPAGVCCCPCSITHASTVCGSYPASMRRLADSAMDEVTSFADATGRGMEAEGGALSAPSEGKSPV